MTHKTNPDKKCYNCKHAGENIKNEYSNVVSYSTCKVHLFSVEFNCTLFSRYSLAPLQAF